MLQPFEVNVDKYELAALPFYTEGPAVDVNGNVFATTLSGGEIVKIDIRGKVSVWAKTDCPNGQVILPDGDHLVCDSKLSSVVRFDSDGNFLGYIVEKKCAGIEVDVPNDLLAAPFGNIFFTDSVRHTGKVFMISGDYEKVLATDLDYPNGLVVSANGRWLYVAESYRNRILRFDISNPVKNSGEYTVFANLPQNPSGDTTGNLPDGLTIDYYGNIWVAHYGMGCIHQYSPQGELLTTIKTGMPLTSNITFADRHSAIVTGGFGEPGPGRIIKIII